MKEGDRLLLVMRLEMLKEAVADRNKKMRLLIWLLNQGGL